MLVGVASEIIDRWYFLRQQVQETPTMCRKHLQKYGWEWKMHFCPKNTLNLLFVDIFCIFKNAKKGHIKISPGMENAFRVQEIPIVLDKK